MPSCTPLNKTMGWKLYSYLEQFPHHYDMAFSVGPKKVLVKALSIILRVSSPVLEKEFKDHWDEAVVKEGEGILLPDFDPVAFKLFLKLMIVDSWSVDSLKALKLPSSQLLHLMTICRSYEMTIAVESLTKLLEELYRNFHKYVETDDFLLLSEQQLESVLASDKIPMSELDVCKYACKWADEQCKIQKLELTSMNRRQVLGDCLYQIRFPLMSFIELATVTRLNEGLLSMEETYKIFQFMGMKENERTAYDKRELKFKCEKRRLNTSIPNGCSVLSLIKVFPVIDTPFVCDGNLKKCAFNTNMTIALRGCGFVGPIDEDSFYDVTVQIWKKINTTNDAAYSEKFEKRILGEKSKTFYFIFDQPIVLEPIPHDGWKNNYRFHFTLKGPDTRSLKSNGSTIKVNDDNREFTISWCNPQLEEILYNTC